MKAAFYDCPDCPHYRGDGMCVCVRPEGRRYPAWLCQRCGAEIGYLGRAIEFLFGWVPGLAHRCRP